MRKIAIYLLFSSLSLQLRAQVTINFDDANLWIAGSGNITSYQNDHSYSDANWTFSGGPALRQSTSTQDGFASAFGTYAWRSRNNSSMQWTAIYNSAGTISQFGFKVRRWDASPSPNVQVAYSTDGGSNFTEIDTIDNSFLNNSSDWTNYQFSFQSPVVVTSNQLVIRLAALGSTERIMIDDFSYQTVSQNQQDLFISEYVEGSGNNKYLEIYNPLATSVDLSDYELRFYSNGNNTPSSTSSLSGSLASGAVVVYANSQATIYQGTTTILSAVNFNGDDAIELFNTNTNTTADVFGQIGCDPGTQWNVSGTETQDQTLRRNPNICQGVQNPTSSCGSTSFDSLAAQWAEYAQNDVSGLGFHQSTCLTCNQASDVVTPIASVQSGLATISWNPSVCFDSVYVFIDTTSGIQANPSGNGSSYTADSVFNAIGQVVYLGIDSVFTVTGLWDDTTFSIEIFTRKGNTWSSGIEILITPKKVGAQVTPGPFGTVITFDQSIVGVNEGVFNGSGLSSNPLGGQLHSDAWRFEGFSDGNTSFGQQYLSGDFARGNSTGNVSSGGLYAFEVDQNNVALGIQPAGSDMTPGCVVLKMRNNSADTIQNVGIAFNLYYRNDQDRSTSVQFSYSQDDLNYSQLNSLSDTTPESSDNLGWQKESKSDLFNGLNLLPGEFVYLKWCTDDLAGSGSRDEWAIDDIQLVSNPGECNLFAGYQSKASSGNGIKDGSIEFNLYNASSLRYIRWSIQLGENYPSTNSLNAMNLPSGQYTLFVVTKDLCAQYFGPIEVK